jgi:tRNA threonylcarbamoyladenosine biosynthesis protein TsaB
MKILLIDACGAGGSVAFADTARDPALVASAALPSRTASERLLSTVKDLASGSGIAVTSLGAVAVVHGPGSFTGVRIGLSAAKGLCEALGIPLIAISRLAVLADLAGVAAGARVLALLDAGRGDFYCGAYEDGVCLREALLISEELLAAIAAWVSDGSKQTQVIVACEPAVAASLSSIGCRLVAEPGAADALNIALCRISEQAFDDVATLDANYLRRTDAEIFAKRPTTVAADPSTTPAP